MRSLSADPGKVEKRGRQFDNASHQVDVERPRIRRKKKKSVGSIGKILRERDPGTCHGR